MPVPSRGLHPDGSTALSVDCCDAAAPSMVGPSGLWVAESPPAEEGGWPSPTLRRVWPGSLALSSLPLLSKRAVWPNGHGPWHCPPPGASPQPITVTATETGGSQLGAPGAADRPEPQAQAGTTSHGSHECLTRSGCGFLIVPHRREATPAGPRRRRERGLPRPRRGACPLSEFRGDLARSFPGRANVSACVALASWEGAHDEMRRNRKG